MSRLTAGSIHCCITSPPYFGLRDYGMEGQIGMEETPEYFVEKMVEVFKEVRRLLRDDGTLWLNIGDSYCTRPNGGVGATSVSHTRYRCANSLRSTRSPSTTGVKHKDLLGIPWMVAFALRADGWYLRQDIIWHKLNPMPESTTDRCTKSHEYLFLLSKAPFYYFYQDGIKERSVQGNPDGTRNKRDVWSVSTTPFKGAHFATFPPALIEPCVLAGCPAGGIILDPFGGAGTTGVVAETHGRNAILCELNPEYAKLSQKRIGSAAVIL
jgi:DNA modification methylase